jgi:3-dehydro-L-gulonate 2-dehydrogenase
MLDLLSSLLSGGKTTAAVDRLGYGSCGSCCQVFIAIDPLQVSNQAFVDQSLQETIEQLRNSAPVRENGEIHYPGERSLRTREENMALGIPVDDGVWMTVRTLAGLVC